MRQEGEGAGGLERRVGGRDTEQDVTKSKRHQFHLYMGTYEVCIHLADTYVFKNADVDEHVQQKKKISIQEDRGTILYAFKKTFCHCSAPIIHATFSLRIGIIDQINDQCAP